MHAQEFSCVICIMYRTILVIFIVFLSLKFTKASVQLSEQEHPEEQHETERIDIMQIPKDQIPLVRLPSNTLLKYTAYKDVSILHFRIPPDTRTALFTFKAYEESKSAFQRVCQPRDVTLHLKAGSYPVISPENITFPRNFLNADQRFQIYNLQFKSNGRTQRLTIDGPQAGNWFAVAFISWTDPNNERIEQQGLAASCETLLLSEMSVARIIPIILSSGLGQNSTLTSDHNVTREISYKFYVPRNVGIVTARITFGGSGCLTSCPDVGFYVQANALPSENNYIYSSIINPNQTGEISFEFYVQSGTWHFIDLRFQKDPMTTTTTTTATPTTGKATTATSSSSSIVTGAGGVTSSPSSSSSSATASPLGIVVTNRIEDELSTLENFNDNNIPSGNNGPNNPNGSSITTTTTDWHELDFFIQVDFHPEEEPENNEPDRPVMFRDIEFYPLLRQTYREFFMFDYDLLPDINGTVPFLLNLTAGTPVGFRFDVGDVYDIGGTLSFAVSLKQDIKGNDLHSTTSSSSSVSSSSSSSSSSTSEERTLFPEKLIDRGATTDGIDENPDEKPSGRSNQTIIICIRLGEPGEPIWPDKCRYGRKVFPASGIVNNSDSDTSSGLIHVPFPESGQWYITMALFCHGAETTARVTIIDSVKEFIRKYSKMLNLMKPPCSCTNFTNYYKNCIDDRKCLMQMNETETLKIKECLMDSKCTANHNEMTKKFEIHHKFATEQSVATEGCNTSVVFAISSSPCVAGRCGRYGRCYHYMSGGFVFSTCLCMKGYRGWDCTEDSQVPSSFSILLASLLLTLSNLLFIPSIYFAIRRKYHTESVIYFFAMFFSIFYHACDSGEDEYSFCLVKIGVLQFCDFYCGLLAIWVTLVAMAHIRQQFVSLLHMFGAIILAFGTELNKQSLWVFLAPALTGICIISSSWGMRCRKTQKWFPSRKYLTIYMPIGSTLVMIGLVCYAFLQTKQNYHIVHSIWHMVMALSILCLLPSRNTFLPKC